MDPSTLSFRPAAGASSAFRRRYWSFSNARVFHPGATRPRSFGAQFDGVFRPADGFPERPNGFFVFHGVGRHRQRVPRGSRQLFHIRKSTHFVSIGRTRSVSLHRNPREIFRDSHLRRDAAQFRTMQRAHLAQSAVAATTVH